MLPWLSFTVQGNMMTINDMIDVEYDDEEGMIAIDGMLYSVDDASALMGALEDAIRDYHDSRDGRPDDIYEYERDERN